MTHTLHPEIENVILKAAENVAEDFYDIDVVGVVNIIYKHLGPYLLPPSQHLKDEQWQPDYVKIDSETKPILTEDIKQSTPIQIEDLAAIGERFYKELGARVMEIPFNNGKITFDFYRDGEQSTPKIDMDKLRMMLYSGNDMQGNSWSSNIPGAILMIADYINNKDLPTNR